MENKYLYGASIQGIQSFIFQTNKLKEIVGASTLVENIATLNFAEKDKLPFEIKGEKIMSAAGNIRYKLDKETCEKMVLHFPQHVANYAPGITISQAVVQCTNNDTKDVEMLEKRLREQRNKPVMPIDIGYMGLERARRTGGVGTEYKDNEVKDRGTQKKLTRENDTLSLFKNVSGKSEIKTAQVPFNIGDITKNENSWLAIIHADGNSIGRKIPKLKMDELSNFSVALQKATEEACKKAFQKVIPELDKDLKKYPIRPVILGGDDLTIIIRADLALDFTVAYLKAFEEETKEKLKNFDPFNNGLTACAGICYIKDSYPFHYGVHLAESLTKEAKKMSKEISEENPPSSLSFYKVQSSYTDELKDMKARTHYSKVSDISFDYGPYFINKIDGKAHVGQLTDGMKTIDKHSQDKSKGVSKLRQWLTMLHQDQSKAQFLLDRMQTINKKLIDDLKEKVGFVANSKTIIYDILQLHSFKDSTKNNKDQK